MKFTRRSLLMLLALLALGDYGRSVFMQYAGTPPGWKTERWQAGFGSWGQGGYGVAYDVSMPKDYDFLQKCGSAWISDNVDGPDFDIRFTYSPEAKDAQDDFALYRKQDLGRDYENDASTVKIDLHGPMNVGKMRFDRTDLTLGAAKIRGDVAGAASSSHSAKGFWLSGENLSIIADLRGAAEAATNERIVGSIRRANAYGWTELLLGTIPGLLGC